MKLFFSELKCIKEFGELLKLIQDELNSVHSTIQIIKREAVIKIGLG